MEKTTRGLELTVRESPDISAEATEDLQSLYPEAVSEGKVDFDRLRTLLGDVIDERPERYFFTWAGKTESVRLLQVPSRATLIPTPEQSVKFETAPHLFIEGDNLEVLKLLHKSYFNAVKMIYIDPPYNTGTDLIYRDHFADPLLSYLQFTGQVDAEGNLLTSDLDTKGRFHSPWLSMMYPRLYLARQLLRDDGVIFVSIDDREVLNLKQAMNQVFGEENFVGMLTWQSKKGGGSDSGTVVTDHEYVLCYARAKGEGSLSRVEVDAEDLNRSDEKGPYRRGRELNKWGANSRRQDRPTMYFPIPGPSGEEVYPIRNDGDQGCWRFGKKTLLNIVERGDAEFVEREGGGYTVYEKIRTTDPRSKPYRTWLTDVGTTAEGSKALKELFDDKKIYDFPKPVELLKHLVRMGTAGEDDIVLDFFAGSCTTGQAVLEVNQEDDGERRFICTQLPEPTPEDSLARELGYETLCDIGRERLRRVLKQMDVESPNAGFKSFVLAPSHYKVWSGVTEADAEAYAEQMAWFVDPLVEGWDESNLLYEISLKEGYGLNPLLRNVEAVEATTNTVYQVIDKESGQFFYACFDDQIAEQTISSLGLNEDDLFICLDRALSDETAANLALQCHLKVV